MSFERKHTSNGQSFFINDGFIPLKQARSPSIQVGTARCRGTQVVGVAGTWAQSFWNALENGKGTYAYCCFEALLVSSSYKFGLLLINCSFFFPIPACLLYNGAISLTTIWSTTHQNIPFHFLFHILSFQPPQLQITSASFQRKTTELCAKSVFGRERVQNRDARGRIGRCCIWNLCSYCRPTPDLLGTWDLSWFLSVIKLVRYYLSVL